MGSVHPYATKSGKRYLVRYMKPDGTQGGKRGFARKRDAERWLTDVESARARGTFIDPQAARITIDALGPMWLSAKKNSMKPSAYAPVETAWRLRVQPYWGGWSVEDIRHTDVREWIAGVGQAVGATVTIRTFGVLASILDDAVFDGRISANPARKGNIMLPRKTKRRHGYLTHSQVRLLAAKSGQHRLLILVLAYTGLRWGEAVALRVEDIDFSRRRIHVSRNAVEVHGEIHVGTPKSHSSRAVPVPQFVIDDIAAAVKGRRRDALVFPGPTGIYMRRTRSSEGSKSWFKTALRAAELPPMAVHDLRHTAASLAVQSGANVKTIQRMLGHTSAAMTLDVYSDLFDDDLDDVATALDRAARSSDQREANTDD